MPIGIVSYSELEEEKENSGQGPTAEIVDQKIGRGIGKRGLPSGLQKIISEEAITNGNTSAKELAREFDVSDSSVSAYKNGATSTSSYNEPGSKLQKYVDKTKLKSTKKAHKTLLSALQSITPDKLADAKPKDLSGIAKDMSGVIKNLEPERAGDDSNAKFIFFAPPMKKMEQFEVIDVVDVE